MDVVVYHLNYYSGDGGNMLMVIGYGVGYGNSGSSGGDGGDDDSRVVIW